MLSPVAVLLLLVSTDASTTEVHTLEYEDAATGDTLLCGLCPPGMYMSTPCTHTLNTVCQPCPPGHFTQFWNFLPTCLHCSVCDRNRVVKDECSATHNRVCECKEGHYWQDDFCVPHKQCPPGQGAKIIGNPRRDTQCGTCPRGTFSAETSSSALCINHTDCGTLHVLFPGRTWHDSVCSSCANLTSEGGLNLLRDVLPKLFSRPSMKLSKLRKLVSYLNGNRQCVRLRALLLLHITEWTKQAHTHQLKALPQMLQRSGLSDASVKVQRMMRRIEKKSQVPVLNEVLYRGSSSVSRSGVNRSLRVLGARGQTPRRRETHVWDWTFTIFIM
ncbi:tumor necrosis factor receptor superfamily member 11B-like [Clarias magur]|uniref:Tumor necrosis factor receptor superfamily member 11B-like n=1 Tax=Clarias magur TaxID=1594786 RepID=A0A8J4UDZ2_CLAMG|nr:tumor necrosis factor receptor superfamily member 11B-like [Clarias magur]